MIAMYGAERRIEIFSLDSFFKTIGFINTLLPWTNSITGQNDHYRFTNTKYKIIK